MANDSNLIRLTTEKAREIGAKGGIASGKAKKEKKLVKEALKDLLEEEVFKDGKATGKTYKDLINLGVIKGAMKGNAINYKTILETIGELEASKSELTLPKLQIEVVDNSNLESVMYENNQD